MELDEILQLPEKEKYELFVLDKQEIPEQYQKVRYGINVKFDYYEHLKGNLRTIPKTNMVKWRGRQFSLTDYYTEIEDRNAIITQHLIDKYIQNEIFKPR